MRRREACLTKSSLQDKHTALTALPTSRYSFSGKPEGASHLQEESYRGQAGDKRPREGKEDPCPCESSGATN